MIFNLDIEKSVIGCILLNKTELLRKIQPDDFSQESYKAIFEAARKLNLENKPVDIISVSDALKDKITNVLEILTNAIDSVPTAENAEYYYKQLREYSIRRRYEKAAHYILEKAQKFDYEDIAEFKADIMKNVDIPVNDFRKKSFELKDITVKTLEQMEEEYKSKAENELMTGYYDLDKLTAGLHPEELTILAARPGVGKTALALNIIINLAKKGVKSALISREMSTIQLAKRIISNCTPLDGNKLRICKALTDTDWEKISNAASEMCEWHVIINDELTSVQEIRLYAKELKSKNMLDVLFVDYLQLCRSTGKHESRRQEVEDVSRQFKEISMELGIPVVVLSQLSRDNVKNGRAPELYDLRESGSIEQDADVVLFLHVPKDTDETQDNYPIQLIVAKQRNGATGYINLLYYKKTFRLMNMSNAGR